MAQVINPPNPFPSVINRNRYSLKKNSVFLAGSIEMGKARDWQSEFIEAFLDNPDLTILNPRRLDWDSSWEQRIENPQFAEQVTWELNGLSNVDIIVFNFEVGTLSPITLLELGRASMFWDTIVFIYCPEGFWRKGNVDILASMSSNFTMVNTFQELIDRVKKMT